MALIKCKKCGRQITDTIKKCPHCGCINDKYRNIKLELFKEKREIITACTLAIICIITFFLAGGSSIIGWVKQYETETNMMSEDEIIASDAVKILKAYLDESDKLIINDIWYRNKSSSNQVLISYFIKDNPRNRNMIIVLIEDSKLIANDVKADKNITKYTAKKESEEIKKAKEVRELWNTKGDAYELFVQLDTNKILKNIEKIEK